MNSIGKLSGVALVGMTLALAGCGSDDDSAAPLNGNNPGGVIGETGGGGQDVVTDGTASTVVITYDKRSIEDLGNGVYRLQGSAKVNDGGRPVPDGTRVYIDVIDSVLAKGTITSGNGDRINGSSLTDYNPMLANGALTTYETAYVIRNESVRFIEPGDHLLLKGFNSSFYSNAVANADDEDKSRIISSADGAISGNVLQVTRDYVHSYPNNTYTSGMTDYFVGASLLGATVRGKSYDDKGEVEYNSVGYAVTKGGIADFVIDYPATQREIHSGCNGDVVDVRSAPLGSAKVMVVATAGSKAVTIDDRFCFSSMLPWKITSSVTDFLTFPGGSNGEAGEPIIVTIVDKNGVKLPYAAVDAVVATSGSGGLEVSIDDDSYITDESGTFEMVVTIDAAEAAKNDSGKITLTSHDGDQLIINVKVQ